MIEMNEFIKYSILFSYYKNLMPEKRKMYLSAYLEEDNSITEISVAFNISRQAVFDNIQKGYRQLDQYEDMIGVFKRELLIKKKLEELKKELSLEKLDKIIRELELSYEEE